MLEAPGAGLAAPQIGVGLRVFTWNVDGRGRPPGQPAARALRGDPGRPRGLPVDPRAHLRLPPRAVGGRPRLRHVRRAGDDRGLGAARPGDPARDRPPRRRAVHRPARPEARKAAMKAIRESEWFGLEQPTVKVSPARHRRARALTDAGRLRRHPRGRPLPALDAIAGVRPRAGRRRHPPRRARRPRPPAGRQPGGASAPRSSASRCSSPSTRATPSSRTALRELAPTAARWSPTARCCPQSALDIPQHGWVNLHFSVLPGLARCRPGAARDLGR